MVHSRVLSPYLGIGQNPLDYMVSVVISLIYLRGKNILSALLRWSFGFFFNLIGFYGKFAKHISLSVPSPPQENPGSAPLLSILLVVQVRLIGRILVFSQNILGPFSESHNCLWILHPDKLGIASAWLWRVPKRIRVLTWTLGDLFCILTVAGSFRVSLFSSDHETASDVRQYLWCKRHSRLPVFDHFAQNIKSWLLGAPWPKSNLGRS